MTEVNPQEHKVAPVHRIRTMSGRDPYEEHRVATPLELLFDLTFVIAFGIAANEFAHMLAENHVGAGLLGFSLATFAVCWAWINFSWFASAYDTDDWIYRLLTMLQMVGVIIMALGFPPMFASIEHGHNVDNRVMVAGYVVMRIALVAQWLRAARQDPEHRSACLAYATAVTVAQVGWIATHLPAHSVPVTFVVVALLIGVELPWTSHRGDPQGRHAVARPSHLRTVWAADDHRARRGCGRHGRIVVGGGQRAGLVVRRRLRGGGRRRAHLRNVVDVFHRPAGGTAPRPPGTLVPVRLSARRDVGRDRGDRRGSARRRVLHRAPFQAEFGRDGVVGGRARRDVHRIHLPAVRAADADGGRLPPAAPCADRGRAGRRGLAG